MYMQFLAHYAPDSVTDLADLCLDISGIIVERSTLLPAILPGSLCKTPTKIANDTYSALLRLFIHYMSRIRRSNGQPPLTQWRDNEAHELIRVHWSHDYATIHFFIVHAQVSSNGSTFLELGKQIMSSADFQAEHLLRSLVFDSSTFCSAWKIVRTHSLFTQF